jgi:hypothetical protein
LDLRNIGKEENGLEEKVDNQLLQNGKSTVKPQRPFESKLRGIFNTTKNIETAVEIKRSLCIRDGFDSSPLLSRLSLPVRVIQPRNFENNGVMRVREARQECYLK